MGTMIITIMGPAMISTGTRTLITTTAATRPGTVTGTAMPTDITIITFPPIWAGPSPSG